MAERNDDNPTAARTRLLELFEGDDWDFSKRARREGKLALHWLYNREPTDGEMVGYVISLLESNLTLRCAPQGDPPGSTGIAWQMTDSRNMLVKLRIEGGFGEKRRQEYAYVQSIHESVHPK
ncbi:MAG TPA: hypothetical protein VNX28_06810 [Gemmataceae bacterium]|jgi:hypothetical protein|nr:hypothetical protein [Gemmataceae bacterium]